MVRSLAASIRRKLPPRVDLDDLIAYGQVGLAEAARDFDPSRGSRFSTYAYYRIRGAIYDGLSKMSWFSRAQYKQVRYQQMADEVLRADGETAADEPTDKEADAKWFGDLSRALIVVHLATQVGDEDNVGAATPEDTSTPEPANIAIGREISRKLHELVDALPDEAGRLIRATYFEGLTLQEAAKRLGVSKSWASRLHAKTLQRLARSLRRMGVAS
jgi:RNA polymerase sigma factor for flagellar operon FliA